MAVVTRENAIEAGGFADTPADRVYVRAGNGLDGVEALRAIPISAGGRRLKLGDIASVSRGMVDPPAATMRVNGKPALGLTISMAQGGNILDLGRLVAARMQTILPTLPLGVTAVRLNDQSQVVAKDVAEFQESFLEALAIVLMVSFLSLGWRTGLVVAISVPLVLAGTLVGMKLLGIDLQRISLGCDDHRAGTAGGRRDHRRRNDAGEAGARLGPDARRRFRLYLDRVSDADRHAGDGGGISAGRVGAVLDRANTRATSSAWSGWRWCCPGSWRCCSCPIWDRCCCRKAGPRRTKPNITIHGSTERCGAPWVGASAARWWVIGGDGGAFRGCRWLGSSHCPSSSFPSSDRLEVLVDMRLPEGGSFAATASSVRQLEDLLRDQKGIRSWVAYSGIGTPRFFLAFSPQLQTPNFAQFVINTDSVPAREALLGTLTRAIDAGNFADVRMRAGRLELGPPGRLSDAVPGHRSGPVGTAPHRWCGRHGHAGQPAYPQRQRQLGQPGQIGPDRYRPGQGAVAGAVQPGHLADPCRRCCRA